MKTKRRGFLGSIVAMALAVQVKLDVPDTKCTTRVMTIEAVTIGDRTIDISGIRHVDLAKPGVDTLVYYNEPGTITAEDLEALSRKLSIGYNPLISEQEWYSKRGHTIPIPTRPYTS